MLAELFDFILDCGNDQTNVLKGGEESSEDERNDGKRKQGAF